MVLLDTSVLVPLLKNESQKLPVAIRSFVMDRDDLLKVSAISLLEVAIKARLGKLHLPYDEEYWPEACDLLGLVFLPLTPQHAVRSVDPWPETNDPFDRVLLSVCSVEHLKLVTTDSKLREHPLAWRA